MIPYERTRPQTIPHPAVKIIGVGGAGANMLDRIALDGMEGAELLACNTDVRTLTSSVAPEKIQMGRNLTKGLGAGGDPELGRQAAHEAELELRDALRDRKIVFICVGLGGGTGSGAAPLVARLAREEGAFTVVFATTPFTFEGKRRREQAETSLNELSVLANALITFDNTRMGDLVLAKQGVHEAFAAADRMISESIRAVTRLVVRPGLVNIGLDDLMAALSSPKSRCLFGSGIAEGENRSQKALKNALESPLLDRGSLLHDTQTVLVHICGGEDLTLYEVELLMRGLSKHVPDTAQILFGASVDVAMAKTLSVTLVSSLPEERLHAGLASERERRPPIEADPEDEEELNGLDEGGSGAGQVEVASEDESREAEGTEVEDFEPEWEGEWEQPEENVEGESESEPVAEAEAEPEPEPEWQAEPVEESQWGGGAERGAGRAGPEPMRSAKPKVKVRKMKPPGQEDEDEDEGEAVKLPSISENPIPNVTTRVKLPPKRTDTGPVEDVFESAKGRKSSGTTPPMPVQSLAHRVRSVEGPEVAEGAETIDDESEDEVIASFETIEPSEGPRSVEIESIEEIRASAKAKRPQGELALDGGPKGKFDGEEPNLLEGEDLDIPPFLRRKK